MPTTFFSRRVPLFGNVAVVILFVVCFLVPFAFRGARMAVRSMKNDVKDWLPKDFPETAELAWFSNHFLGESFVVITWPGCTRDDPSFQLLVDKLRAEILPTNVGDPASDVRPFAASDWLADDQRRQSKESERAHQRGDELGLHSAADFHENWGGRGEKWLLGNRGQWYFITPAGELVQWDGESNLLGGAWRALRRLLTGRNVATGRLVDRFGSPPTADQPNPFHKDPRRITARFFKTVRTGPELLDQMTGDNGSLNVQIGRNQLGTDESRHLAFERLTGVLFGPQPPRGFKWTLADFQRVVPSQKIQQLPADWITIFHEYVSQLVVSQYQGRHDALLQATNAEQSKHWEALFKRLDVEPPARQTCILVTLSEPATRDLSCVVGRPILGKPRGRILELAVGECGIPEEDLRLGGPPIDNVAIDQEGMITLVELVGFCALVGFALTYLCFRSVKLMFFVLFVGAVSASASLGIVWWTGSAPDAISMSMPSLVYVLGLSGAVHIINYYRDAVQERGLECAPERALQYGWFPCTIAAFTTSLGLLSLCVSTLTPIKRFGLYAAIGVLATVLLLFSFLPAALEIWPSRFSKRGADHRPLGNKFRQVISQSWLRVADWILVRHRHVAMACTGVVVLFALGLPKIKTTVQLLKLFDKDARIIADYTWLESHLCKLVPVELVACVDAKSLRPNLDELETSASGGRTVNQLQFSFLERAELAGRIQTVVEREFGDDGRGIVGRGMSAAVFIPPFPDPNGGGILNPRGTFNGVLEHSRKDLLEAEYLAIDEADGRELWRISLRAAALNDVDYGYFVLELNKAVEPIMSAYRYRNQILKHIQGVRGDITNSSVYVLGVDPKLFETTAAAAAAPTQASVDTVSGSRAPRTAPIDQTKIFAQTLDDLLRNRGYRRRAQKTRLDWHDPNAVPLTDPEQRQQWTAYLNTFDCIVLAKDHSDYDLNLIRQHAQHFIDARDYGFDPTSPSDWTAAQRKARGDEDVTVTTVYTGIVPIVYKAQRALLESLVKSIGLAFVMIAVVMMLLLRDWRQPAGPSNTLNLPGGLVSMLPNVFPIVLVFGAMGHLGISVDIGSMMTASVALGVAVDDTIHFLNWFRKGLRAGLSRQQAIRQAYERCATAMTQTTLIGGFGLAVFGFSTFTPTQQFGVLMLVLLVAALVGDLIYLPALLAGPLGRYLEVCCISQAGQTDMPPREFKESPVARGETPHSSVNSSGGAASTVLRRDRGHDTLGS